MTSGRLSSATGAERLVLIALIPAAIFAVVTLYVRITSEPDPHWTEFGTPVFFALLGARALVAPAAPQTRKAQRIVGALLLVLGSALILFAIFNSQGAN